MESRFETLDADARLALYSQIANAYESDAPVMVRWMQSGDDPNEWLAGCAYWEQAHWQILMRERAENPRGELRTFVHELAHVLLKHATKSPAQSFAEIETRQREASAVVMALLKPHDETWIDEVRELLREDSHDTLNEFLYRVLDPLVNGEKEREANELADYLERVWRERIERLIVVVTL